MSKWSMCGAVALVLAVGIALSSAAAPGGTPARRAQMGDWGVDLSGRDLSVKPGDDFYRYANGQWLATHEIPADRTSWGAFDELAERTLGQVHDLLEALPPGAPAGSNGQKLHDYYRAFLDTAAIESAGIAPAQPGLDAIAAARTHEDIGTLMGRADLELTAPINLDIDADEKDPDHYMVTIAEGGLGLPDRDYYLKDDASYREVRTKYAAHIERLLRLAGRANAGTAAHEILELETQIAGAHWPVAKRRERELRYNPVARADLPGYAPGFPWPQLLAAAGLESQSQFVVRESDAIQALGKQFRQVPVAKWQTYLSYHYLVAKASVLPRAIDDEVFDFYGRTLHGQPEQRARWKRAVRAVDGALGEAAGELYVRRYFPPAAKAQMLELVENLRAAYREHIENLAWMSAATRKVALEKLAAFRPKIGYPERWRDYTALEVKPGDAFGNGTRGVVFEWQRELHRLGQPTDRDEWGMTPQTINAYYNPTFNEVVFPAAILQPPFFDPNADSAVNYGGIGGVIGHEMGHGFDDQGAKSDARGVLHNWWLPQDSDAFHQRVDRLDAQYAAFEALPGLKVNGRLTLGENIGDLGGVSVAYAAYHRSLHVATAPVLSGLSGDQRFFLSWAQVWREKQRDEDLRAQVTSNPHSPSKFRVNGVVRNVDAWYPAFSVQAGERLYLPPDERVRIW